MKANRVFALVVVIFALGTRSAMAIPWQLTVTYTNGVVVQGPLSMGLDTLPESVTATFLLEGGITDFPSFGPASVIAASLPFGDGTFDQGDLHDLSVIPQYDDSGAVLDFTTVSYRMGGAHDGHLNPWIDDVGIDALADPCVSRWPTTFCRIGRNSNFELNLFALDAATDEFVHYRYFTSEQQLVKVPEPSTAALAFLGLAGWAAWRLRRRRK